MGGGCKKRVRRWGRIRELESAGEEKKREKAKGGSKGRIKNLLRGFLSTGAKKQRSVPTGERAPVPGLFKGKGKRVAFKKRNHPYTLTGRKGDE